MLSQVTITGFRCFPQLSAKLRPLTILIGPNDSGKSAFLTALKYLVDGQAFSLPTDYWRLIMSPEAGMRGKTSQGDIALQASGGRSGSFEGAVAAMQPVQVFRLPSLGLDLKSSGQPDSGKPPDLGADGNQLPAWLDFLLRRDRARFDTYVQAVKERVPGLDDIHIPTPDPSSRRVDLVLEGGLILPPYQLSVGVRFLLFFVALAHHSSPPRLILIEEPENGVHPKRLGDIVKLLRDITRGLHGNHAAQVVLSTHSPYLLDHVDLEQDQVLVFRRNDDGSRSAEAVDRERLRIFLGDFMLGEVWYNEGEEGLVKSKA